MQTVLRKVHVAFQGEPGAFGDEALRAYFGQYGSPFPYQSFADVFQGVAAGEMEYGVVPVENSQAGSIHEVYDLLRAHNLFVIGEICHPVNHCLLALPGQEIADITRVISHPQALAQCDVYLRTLGVETRASYNTAGCAKMIQEQRLTGVAAIASAGAAELYQLQILARDIQTIKDNYTRFLVLGSAPAARQPGPTKTMLAIATQHRYGTLHACLGTLAENRINLLKLEVRPSRQQIWEYIFYLDFEGHQEDGPVRRALAQLTRQTTFCKVLGSFASTHEAFHPYTQPEAADALTSTHRGTH